MPAKNEQNRIGNALEDYKSLQHAYGSLTLVVVTDSEQDPTNNTVAKFTENYADLRLLAGRSHGKGGAIIQGFKSVIDEASDGDIIGFVDADDAVRAGQIIKVVNEIASGNAACAVGSRKCKGVNAAGIPFSRRAMSTLYATLVRYMFGIKIKDMQCGCKFVTANALRAVIERLAIEDVVFDLNMLYELSKAGKPIREVCIDYVNVKGGISPRVFLMLKTTIEYRIFGYAHFAKRT